MHEIEKKIGATDGGAKDVCTLRSADDLVFIASWINPDANLH